MSRKSEEEPIRQAWADLCNIAECWDWTAPRMLHEAEKAEAREARGAGVNYPKVEQLAGLCETALEPPATLAGLYQLRAGHRDVAITAAAMRDRWSEKMQEWAAQHGAAIKEFRSLSIGAV
jgi:hypothetical protein